MNAAVDVSVISSSLNVLSMSIQTGNFNHDLSSSSLIFRSMENNNK